MPEPTDEDVARTRRLAGEDRVDSPYTDEDLTERLTRLTCPERTDPFTLVYTPARPDVYGAAAEVWEEKALALIPAPGVVVPGSVRSERTSDVSITFDGSTTLGVKDAYAMMRRMARRSCTFTGGTRSVDLLPPGPGRSLSLTLATYDLWFDAVMAAERYKIAPYDEAVINRAEPRG